ncbi:oxidoreductase [Vibrio neptunius]|uniref:oxidoreductase n=1 Tax=Vibrio neptunius TaxID=170651 RepID=UPI0019D125A7|nr:oxidoreductase [Vibrio neptunius]MBN3575778.1 SDR family oxidoreductase [Vibrio neptunius]
MNGQLENKVILIAGAGGLLGSQIVAAALKQGATVIAADLSVEDMKQRLKDIGVNTDDSAVLLTELDISDQDSVRAIFEKSDKTIDGAVNATYPRNRTYGKHFFDVNAASFNENVSLHLGSAFLFTQQAAAYFKNSNKPLSLVNLSSIYGVVAPKFEIYDNTSMTMPVEYAAIKSAIQHLSKYVAAYVNNSNFRINCVSPGGIFDNQPESFLHAYAARTHGAGMLDVRDVVGSVLFLLSEQSRYVTGQNIIIDDGFSL